VIAYASRTGTRRNLKALREAGWRLMVSARGVLRTEGFPYALDNGAWTAFQEFLKGLRAENILDIPAFEKAVKLLGADADWIVVPDIVMGGEKSLALSITWIRKLRRRRALRGKTLMLVVQNGMETGPMFRTIKRMIGPRLGVFVGGDTDWKLATMGLWGELARARAALCHVGRVNTLNRIRACELAGVDSFDGSSASRFAVTVAPMDAARRQADLFTPRRPA
jgi:hypothetical protein